MRRSCLLAIASSAALVVSLWTVAPTPALALDVTDGTVSGVVVRPSGAPWGHDAPQVQPYRLEGAQYEHVDDVQVAAMSDGTFSMELPAGTYRFLFQHTTRFGSYFTSWYGGDTLQEADDVTVLPAATVTGIDGLLDSEGRVSGRVTDEDGAPLVGVRVFPVEMGKLSTDVGARGAPPQVVTDERGRYSFGGVIDAAYRLRFEPRDDRFVSRYWPSAPLVAPSRAVELVTGLNGDIDGVDMVLPHAGIVTGALDAPAPPAFIPIRPVAYGWKDGAWVELSRGTHGDGRYRIGGLEAGRVKVCLRERFDCIGGSDPASATALEVRRGRTTRAGVRLAEPGSIAGTVSGVPADALDDVEVVLHRVLPGELVSTTSTRTDASGRYRFDAIPVGAYRVQFLAPTSPPQDDAFATQEFWPDADALDEATSIAVRAGRDISGIDATIDVGATFSGVLEDDGDGTFGSPSAQRRNRDGSWVEVPAAQGYSSSEPAPDGSVSYTMGGLRPGTYRFAWGLREYSTLPDVATTYVPDSPTPGGAQLFTVPSLDTHLTGIDGNVDLGAVIEGTARNLGTWITRGDAVAYRKVGTSWVEESRIFTSQFREHHFLLNGLQGGTYRVGFEATSDLFEPTFGGDGTPQSIADAADIHVARGEAVEGLEIRLRPSVRAARAPHIIGRPRVGRTVRVDPGLWSPNGTRLTFRWLVDGTPISGATGRSYVPRRRDQGARLSVRIGGHRGAPWLPHIETTRAAARVTGN